MADEILEIGARVNVSEVGSAMQDAASEVSDATSQMQTGFDKVAVSTREYAIAQQNLRSTIKETITGQLAYVGGLQGEEIRTRAVSEAIAQATAAKRNLLAATKEQQAAEEQATAAAKAEAEAQVAAATAAKAAAEAHIANALGLREEAEASNSASTGLGNTRRSATAATGALRELEGGIPLRTISSFASQSAALAPILEAAFPIIGAVALTEFVVQLAGKFTELWNQVVNYSDEAAAALKQEEALDKQFEKSIDVSDRLRQKVAELTAGRLALKNAGYDPNSGKAPTSAQLKQEETGEKKGAATNKAADDENNLATLKRQAVEVGTEMGKLQSIVEGVTYGNRQLAAIKLEPLAQQYENLQQSIRNATTQQSIDQAEATKEGMKLASEGAEASAAAAKQSAAAARQAAAERKRADQEAFRSWQETLQQQQLAAGAFYQTQSRDAMAYWANILNSATLSASQRAEVEKAYLTARNQASKESLEDWVEGKKEEVAEQAKTSEQIIVLYQQIQAAMVDAYGAGSKQAAAAQREVLKATEDVAAAQDRANKLAAEAAAKVRKPDETAQTGRAQQAQAEGSGQEKIAKADLEAGLISLKQYEAAVQQSEDRVYAIRLDALQKRRALEALDPNGPQETAITDNEILKLKTDNENRITAQAQQQTLARVKMATSAMTQISSATATAFSSWEHGSSSFSASFGKSLGGMVTQLQGKLLQMGAMWAMHYAEQKILHISTNLVKTTSDATTAATSEAIQKSTDAQKSTSAAVTAFKNTYASVSGIPIVGPVLAPIAASAAFVAVEAFSAQGGMDIVPADNTLVNLHKNEMVLSSPLADGVRKMSGQGGGPKTVNQHFGGNTFNGSAGEDFPAQLDKHEDALAFKMKSLMRDGKI